MLGSWGREGKMRYAVLVGIIMLGVAAPVNADDSLCTYNTWEWDTKKKVSVNHRTVKKLRAELTNEEKDAQSECSVCSEDQTWISIAGRC